MRIPEELQSRRSLPTRRGEKVRFLASDVFLCGAEQAVYAPPGEAELEGTVIDFSDSGLKSQVFAVIEMVRKQVVIVPIEKLRLVEVSDPQQ